MYRITTNGILRNYKSSLTRSNTNLHNARKKVLTQRNFNSYAEDPAAATQAFQLRRSFWRTSDQITNSTTVVNKFDSAWDVMDTVINDLVDSKGKISTLIGMNDPTGIGRVPLSKVLSQSAESIVQNMNTQYGESFIFAGADGLNVPFKLDDTGNLLYRGININTTDPEELAQLEQMTKEKTYVNLGMGLEEDSNGDIIDSSAFNSAIAGIELLGYGTDHDGDPKNPVSLMMEISNIFERCDKETGDFQTNADKERANRLSQKLQNSLTHLTSKHTEMDVQASFLHSNTERLESTAATLNEQILSIEQCDLAEAITSFSWAQYCYNASLKVGNSILSQSLIDYMH